MKITPENTEPCDVIVDGEKTVDSVTCIDSETGAYERFVIGEDGRYVINPNDAHEFVVEECQAKKSIELRFFDGSSLMAWSANGSTI